MESNTENDFAKILRGLVEVASGMEKKLESANRQIGLLWKALAAATGRELPPEFEKSIDLTLLTEEERKQIDYLEKLFGDGAKPAPGHEAE